MRQLFPPLPPEKTSRDDIVNLLPRFDDSIVAVIVGVELPMQIGVEYLQPLHDLLQIDVGILGMVQKLPGICHLHVAAAIEGQEDGWLEIACLFFEMLQVSGEHIDQISHDERNIRQRLVLWFGVHD